MNKYRKINHSITQRIITVMLMLTLPVIISWSQTCDKTAKSGQTKPIAEQLAGYSWNGDLAGIQNQVDMDGGLVNIRLQNEETMLTIAAWKGNYEIAVYLISKGANVNCRNDWQNTPLHNAAQKGFNNIIMLLLDNGAAIDARGTSGNNALFFAAENEHAETMELLLKSGSQVDAVNDYGQTPLLRASWTGNSRIIGLLIQYGANVNYADNDGNTAIQNLAGGGYTELVKLLIDAGADVNKYDNEGKTALHKAVINKKPEVVELLLGRMEDFNIQEKRLGNTPLHIAAINGDIQSTKLLLNSGANTDIRNYSRNTALDYAVKYGNADVVACYDAKSPGSKDMLAMARKNQSNALTILNKGEAKVIYCGHSGYAVQTKNYLMIFDYWKRNQPDQPGLANGSINPEEIKDKNVIVFVSHDHSDHYDTAVYEWKKIVKNITYIYGFKPEESWIHKDKGYHGPDYVYIDDNQSRQVGELMITTLKSTDSGQGFLVTVDGLTVYHPGDHAWFSPEDEAPFKKEVDFISGKAQQVDIAFLPVTGCPSRWKKEYIVEGFFYSIDKLNPSQVFPMHAFQREYITKEFTELAEKRMVQNQIVCAENSGDNYQYIKNMVASK